MQFSGPAQDLLKFNCGVGLAVCAFAALQVMLMEAKIGEPLSYIKEIL